MGGLATPIATVRDVAAQLAATGQGRARRARRPHRRRRPPARRPGRRRSSTAARRHAPGIRAGDVIVTVDGDDDPTPRPTSSSRSGCRQPGDRVPGHASCATASAERMTVDARRRRVDPTTDRAEPAAPVSTG